MRLPDKVEACRFECEAGPLEQCRDWEALKAATDLWVVLKRGEIVQHTRGKGGWGFYVFTNELEAQNVAEQWNRENYGGAPVCSTRHLLEAA